MTLPRRAGDRGSQVSKISATAPGRRSVVYAARVAPAVAAAWRIAGISWSVRPGTTGATMTPHGTPALAIRCRASRRGAGREVRGSIAPQGSSSKVVIEMNTGPNKTGLFRAVYPTKTPLVGGKSVSLEIGR